MLYARGIETKLILLTVARTTAHPTSSLLPADKRNAIIADGKNNIEQVV